MDTKVSIGPLQMGALIGVLGTCQFRGGVTKELFYRKCNTRGAGGKEADQYWEEWLKIENAFPEIEQMTLINALTCYIDDLLNLIDLYRKCNCFDDYTIVHAYYMQECRIFDELNEAQVMEIATSMTHDLSQDKVNGKAFYGRLKKLLN